MSVDSIAIDKLTNYLRINTVHPDPDYGPATEFLKAYAAELGLSVQVFELHRGKPVVIITWQGSESSIGSILLNSHVDVVPVEEDKWTYPPFEARHVNGKIYARGAQDIKVLGVIHLEAIRRLKSAGFVPKRTVHVSLVPDEEIGGHLGMELFAKSKEFAALNVAFALDEGAPSAGKQLNVYYGERLPWWVSVKCTGKPGHGSQLKSDTAGEKLWRVTNKLMNYRTSQKVMLDWAHPNTIQLADLVSVNMTEVAGGKQPNVIPSELSASFDIRIPPTVDLKLFEQQLATWCREAATESGGSVDTVVYSFLKKDTNQAICEVAKEPAASFWSAMRGAIESRSHSVCTRLFFGATDSRFLRELGIPALGFTPLTDTPFLLHDHDEHVSKDVFLEGINIFVEVLGAITAV